VLSRMKIAVISDVHSNIEALRAVLDDIAGEDVSAIIQLGDVVGYNANPAECVELVQRRRMVGVLGNHDRAVTDPRHAESFNILAYQAVMWSAKALGPEHKRFLTDLPQTRVLWGRYLLFHGAPGNPDAYVYYLFQAKKVFNYMRKKTPDVRLAFFGHTHQRTVWERNVRGKAAKAEIIGDRFSLDPEHMYLINPGSVGQPRQHHWQASYLVFDEAVGTVRFKYVPYDLATAQAKIRQARLPEYLAERLAAGV
jgi:predicted phosphodiesterase